MSRHFVRRMHIDEYSWLMSIKSTFTSYPLQFHRALPLISLAASGKIPLMEIGNGRWTDADADAAATDACRTSGRRDGGSGVESEGDYAERSQRRSDGDVRLFSMPPNSIKTFRSSESGISIHDVRTKLTPYSIFFGTKYSLGVKMYYNYKEEIRG